MASIDTSKSFIVVTPFNVHDFTLRPLNKKERDAHAFNCFEISGLKEVSVKHQQNTKRYTFDRVFGPRAKQIDLYSNVVKPVIEEVLTGYNCTIFAYGQTGSGKTHTMAGGTALNGDIPWMDVSLYLVWFFNLKI